MRPPFYINLSSCWLQPHVLGLQPATAALIFVILCELESHSDQNQSSRLRTGSWAAALRRWSWHLTSGRETKQRTGWALLESHKEGPIIGEEEHLHLPIICAPHTTIDIQLKQEISLPVLLACPGVKFRLMFQSNLTSDLLWIHLVTFEEANDDEVMIYLFRGGA